MPKPADTSINESGIYSLTWAPLGWATAQNNLGSGLQALGEREAGTTRREEAVAAYPGP